MMQNTLRKALSALLVRQGLCQDCGRKETIPRQHFVNIFFSLKFPCCCHNITCVLAESTEMGDVQIDKLYYEHKNYRI